MAETDTIKMKRGLKPAPENNMVSPQAMYGDIDDIDSDSDRDEDQEESEEEESEEEESEEEKVQEKYYADKSKSNNAFKVEINVDDI